MKTRLIVVFAVVVTAAIALFWWQQSPPPGKPRLAALDSLRHPPAGPVIGFHDAYNTHAWLGIPFAQPPVGERRWQAPRFLEPWPEPHQALAPGLPCIQFWGEGSGVEDGEPGTVVGSEDCLSLNIWAPAMSPEAIARGSERLPVMVWIHGGGNTAGTANTYSGHHLADNQRVIVVAVNYRLGLFGWFSHAAMRDTAATAEDASGNYGLLDIIAALAWVRDNIAAFGGDPANVTVFGESAGGRNVYALIASPRAKGLFHRAIVQSGSLLTVERTWAENYNDATARGGPGSAGEVLLALLQGDGTATSREAVKQYLGAVDAQALMRELRAKTPESLLSAFTPAGFGMYTVPTNIRDGHVLPRESLLQLFTEGGAYNRVPLLVGANRDEHKVFMAQDPAYVDNLLGVLPRIRDAATYDRIAAYHSDLWKALSVDEPARALARSAGAPVFTYRFDWDDTPKTWMVDFPALIGAGHALELGFVFGDFEGGLTFPFLVTEDNRPGREYLSRAMMDYWGNFAATGDPGQGRSGEWPRWTAWASDSENQMVFDSPAEGGVRMTSEPLSAQLLKERLQNDPAITSAEERCRLFVRLLLTGFQTRDYWDDNEYREFAGGECRELDPYHLAYGPE